MIVVYRDAEAARKFAIYCSSNEYMWPKLFATKLFIHSFVPDISIAPLQVNYYSEAFPTTTSILCRS